MTAPKIYGPTDRLVAIHTHLRTAQNARWAMQGARGQIDTDTAVIDYSRALDEIYTHLDALDRSGALDEIENLASVVWGRV